MSERSRDGLEEHQALIDRMKKAQPQYASGWDEVGRYGRFLASEGRIPSSDVTPKLSPEHRTYSHKHFEFDIDGHSVIVGGRRVKLTKMNFDLLNYLVARPNRVVSRIELIENVWENYGSEATVNVHVVKLRKILPKGHDIPEIIRTVFGTGYMLYDERIDPNVKAHNS